MVQANVSHLANTRPTHHRLLIGLLSAFVLLCAPALTGAQDWKAALLAEQAKNATRLTAIDAEAGPVATKLRANTAAIKAHNAQHPNGTCTYPAGHPEVCAPWIREATRLNTEKTGLVSRLQPLADESDRLIARNKEIAARLRCVPLPTACTSDAQCNECSTCSTFDGRGASGICQPRP